MPSINRPQTRFFSIVDVLEACFFADVACRVKTATPAVTARITAYLCHGYLLPNSVMCRNMTGKSLHDLARMKVI